MGLEGFGHLQPLNIIFFVERRCSQSSGFVMEMEARNIYGLELGILK